MAQKDGYWVVRTYKAGSVGEKTKFWVPGKRPDKKLSRRQKALIKKQAQNEYSAVKRLARDLHENYTSDDIFLGLDYSDAGMKKLEKWVKSLGLDLNSLSEEEKQAILEGFLDDDINMEMNEEEVTADQVSFEGSTMRVEVKVETMAIEFRQISNAILALLVGMALIMVTLFFVSGVCKAFRDCESPFEENVIVNMKKFAYSLIPWLIGSSVIGSVGESILAGKPVVNFSLDLGMVLVVLVLFLLITIFKYGAILQQESDETL